MVRKENEVIGSGRYKLTKVVGVGSYGVVWLADDLQLHTKVAIKTLDPHMGKIADLQKEALTQASLKHPYIARIYSVDIDDRFIAMEYIEGHSLDHYLQGLIAEGKWIPEETATQYLSQCFEAILYAHEHSVVHGDIKPGNIMIDEGDVVKITDFGVAKVMSGEDAGAYGGGTGRRVGSITYMAPEVLCGQPRTFSNDIFSLGVVAYLLFTGYHPFYNGHPSGLFGVREMLLSDREAMNPTEIKPDIRESRAAILLKMLAKDPKARYATMKEAYQDFADVGLRCTLCQAKNEVNAKFCSQCGKSLKEVIEAQFREKRPEDLSWKAFQLNGLGQYEEAIVFCDAAIGLSPVFPDAHPDAHHTKAWALSHLERHEEAIQSYEKALKCSPTSTRRDRSRVANIYTNMAYSYGALRNWTDSKKALEKALEYDPSNSKARDLLERGHQKRYWDYKEEPGPDQFYDSG